MVMLCKDFFNSIYHECAIRNLFEWLFCDIYIYIFLGCLRRRDC